MAEGSNQAANQPYLPPNDNNIYALPHLPHRREGSSSFVSHVARFSPGQHSQTPGPGASHWNITKRSAPEELFPREHMWLIENQRFGTAKSPTGPVGPGSYNVRREFVLNPLAGRFSQKERFNERDRTQSDRLGPGCYNYQEGMVSEKLSPARRTQAKSYLSTIIPAKQPALAVAAAMNDRKKLDTSLPGPGHYSPKNQNEEPKKGMSSQFSSKVPRFANRSDIEVAPGMYHIQGDFERALRKIHSPHEPIVRTAKSPTIKIVKSIDMPQPGPGAYDSSSTMQRELLKKYMSGYKGDFGSHEQRFKATKYHRSIPGPGAYNRPQKSIQHEQRIRQLKNSPQFISSSSRDSLLQREKFALPFGGYNLRQFNISYRASKKKEHIDKLRSIEIEVPAFESKARR